MPCATGFDKGAARRRVAPEFLALPRLGLELLGNFQMRGSVRGVSSRRTGHAIFRRSGNPLLSVSLGSRGREARGLFCRAGDLGNFTVRGEI